jgi:general secretion pathway protein G
MKDRNARRIAGARAGFTLIEVMIVIAIVLALATVVGVAVFGRRDQAKKDMGTIDLNTIKNAMGQFRLDFDRWPKDEEGVAVLWDKSKLDPEAEPSKWKGPYLQEPMPKDRWGNEWGYRQVSERSNDETKFDLWSFGPDGQEGTEDDLNSWGTASGDGSADGMEDAPPPVRSGSSGG